MVGASGSAGMRSPSVPIASTRTVPARTAPSTVGGAATTNCRRPAIRSVKAGPMPR